MVLFNVLVVTLNLSTALS